jgi:predicted GH43/DUF377 family glycosyl hydrolase
LTKPSPRLRHLDIELRPDPARVVAKTFLPGQEILTAGISRASAVLDRIGLLTESEVERLLEKTLAGFSTRHRDLPALLDARFDMVAHRLDHPDDASSARRQLVGACFTQEYSVEAAALFNPSMVMHPDQSGVETGSVRFVMSMRGVGEGHLSSVEFRSGIFDGGNVLLDESSGVAVLAESQPGHYSKAVLAQQLAEMGNDESSSDYVLSELPSWFGRVELDAAVSRLDGQGLTRGSGAPIREAIEWIAACNYSITFPHDSSLDERVMIPASPSESHGLEDVRLVRFTGADGVVDFRGTYTAFDGSRVAPQMLRTNDFRTFHVSQLAGPAAKDKGMALFPRQIHGDYFALSRWDRENTMLATSGDLRHWHESATLQTPLYPWEMIQVGNCGSPIETAVGWLVLTHGVGPMREYSIGAMLLDLDDPRIMLGRLAEPLLAPMPGDRSGYVPSVVYSCGGMIHVDTLVLPYGCNDATIRFALIDVPSLLDALLHTRSVRT